MQIVDLDSTRLHQGYVYCLLLSRARWKTYCISLCVLSKKTFGHCNIMTYAIQCSGIRGVSTTVHDRKDFSGGNASRLHSKHATTIGKMACLYGQSSIGKEG